MGTVPATLAERIDAGYPELSPQEQRAADFMRDHIADLAVYNATEVATLSGVSKATVSRLYRRLGFDSAEDLRDHVRAVRSSGTPIATGTTASFAEHLEQELSNLRNALTGLDLEAPAKLIASAGRVLVVGFRNSYPVALHLRQQLAQAREGVALAPLPGQSIGEELASLRAGDVVVLVGFRRRPAGFAALVESAAAGPAAVILLSDSRRYAGKVDVLIECPVDSVSAFDSYAAAASVVNLLSSAALAKTLPASRERIASIGRSYAALDELEGA